MRCTLRPFMFAWAPLDMSATLSRAAADNGEVSNHRFYLVDRNGTGLAGIIV